MTSDRENWATHYLSSVTDIVTPNIVCMTSHHVTLIISDVETVMIKNSRERRRVNGNKTNEGLVL